MSLFQEILLAALYSEIHDEFIDFTSLTDEFRRSKGGHKLIRALRSNTVLRQEIRNAARAFNAKWENEVVRKSAELFRRHAPRNQMKREAAIYPDTAGGAVNYVVEEVRESAGSVALEALFAGDSWLVLDHDRQRAFLVDLREEGAHTETAYHDRDRDANRDWTGLEGFPWTNEWWVHQYSPLLRRGRQRSANPAWWGPDSTPAPLNQFVTIGDLLDEPDPLLEVACDNAYYDPYLYGMANGIIFVRSLISGEDPVYMDAPVGVAEEWGREESANEEAAAGFRDARCVFLGNKRRSE